MADSFDRLKTALADRYAIDEEIGSGGMATVYLAEDLKLHRKVALKVLRPELTAALGPERFLREIEILARLSHPGIVPLLESGEAAHLVYYVMPFLDGESLRERLRRDRALPVHEALQITSDVAATLSYVHSQGIIHRDIKPENIWILEGQTLLLNFDVARASDEADDSERLTDSGFAAGTPEYMSPEQVTGESVDGRADVYSLGCVVYEMLAGEPPLTGGTAQDILVKTLSSEEVPSLRVVRPQVPEPVWKSIKRSLAKVPADRYDTALQFLESLVMVLDAMGGGGGGDGGDGGNGGDDGGDRPRDLCKRVGATLKDEYRVLRQIGEGGMAVVCLAEDLHNYDRRVAIKVLRPQLAATIDVERFLQEIRITANFKHPLILMLINWGLIDWGDLEGLPFYVMLYMGESLRDRLTHQRKLVVDDAVRIATDVADALDYAHREGVVHRDVTPGNILLGEGHALVSDFGIALAVTRGGKRYTTPGQVVGSVDYMSPEQLKGSVEIDGRSDEYSLACVVYEMLAGTRPYTGSSQVVSAKHLSAPIPRLADAVPGIRDEVEDAVCRALAKDPNERFDSAGEFVAAMANGQR